MTIRCLADTHAILWYLYDDSRLSALAAETMDAIIHRGDQIAIASITLAELIYLAEKDRISPLAFERVGNAIEQANPTLVAVPFDLTVAKAMRQIKRSQVPELPDRIIAATAYHLGVPVISRDHKIQASIVEAIW